MSQNAYKWFTGILVSLGIFIALLDTTIVDIVLPKMMPSLSTDLYGVQWVVIIYFVGAAVAMTAAAWVAARIGARVAYVLGLLVFVGASAVCGAAWSLPVMLAARFVQGLGEGLLVPVGMVILFEVFPPEEHGAAMGLYGLAGSFSPAAGPTLGGLITEHLNWRWVFYVNLPIGLLDVALILLVLKGLNHRSKPRFDGFGFGAVALALSALIVLLGKGQELGWLTSDLIVALLVATVVFGVAAVLRLRFGKEPLFPRRVLREPLFQVAITCMILLSINAYGFFLLLPVFMQRLRGLTTLQAGLILLPGSILTAIFTLASGVLCDRFDPRKVGFVTLLLTGVASWLFTTDPDTPIRTLVFDYMLWGATVGGTFVPAALLAVAPLRDEDIGFGSTIQNVSRLVAGSIGTAVSTALLSAKADAYTVATLHFLEPGRPNTEALAAAARALGPTYYRSDLVGGARYIGEQLVRRQTTSWAFHSVYQVLALFMIGGALVFAASLAIKLPRGMQKKKAAVH